MESEVDFNILVDRHYGALYRFALSLTRSESDACDLVQGVFQTWAIKGHQLENPAKVKSWLFTTLHRAFLERQRRVSRFPEVELLSAAMELPQVDPVFVERLDGRTALDMLGTLHEQFRAPLALFYLDDYPYAEIAEILEVPLGTVKSRIARGLAQLRARVAQEQRPRPQSARKVPSP